jgi:hypothetical protein
VKHNQTRVGQSGARHQCDVSWTFRLEQTRLDGAIRREMPGAHEQRDSAAIGRMPRGKRAILSLRMTEQKIRLPPPSPSEDPVLLEKGSRVVVVGANGSGKTRFGIWVEDNNQGQLTVHRISAQKVLNLPDYAEVKNVEQAQKELLYGRSDEHASVGRKVHDRWGNNPATYLLTDYGKLLALLFAKEAERNKIHTEETRRSGTYLPVSDSPIDSIVKVWADLMPHRTISLHDGKVVVAKGTPGEYHAKEMSDGERVTLYLLGQCLCAPQGSLLIIDEPELHLHKSIMDKLWNKIEELCPDKAIVYITHDLDFAATRIAAKKLWIRSFDGKWTWQDIPVDESLPEALVLEIVGNRKRLLFCEGERGGLDHTIYQACYPEFHVIPRGGSDKVVEAAKALRANASLHTFAARGIVDLDVRDDSETAALSAHGIEVLGFAEIENILCTEALVAIVARQLSHGEEETIEKVRTFVSAALTAEIEAQVVMRSERRIRYLLSHYSASSSEEKGLADGLTALLNGVDIARIVEQSRKTIQDALAATKLNALLKVYNRKSMAERISTCFGLKPGEYPAFVLRLLNGPERGRVVEALLAVAPAITAT